MISMIVAIDLDGGIGKNNTLPWKIKEDMQFFKKTTTNHTVVMGRKTFESIGKPLPNRENIILSNTSRAIPGALCFSKVDAILGVEAFAPQEQIFIIGGSEIYKLFEAHVCEVYLTVVNGKYDCDTFLNLDFLNDFYLESSLMGKESTVDLQYKFLKLTSKPNLGDNYKISNRDNLFRF